VLPNEPKMIIVRCP